MQSYVRRFPAKSLTKHNLTLSHEMRVKINAKLNKLWAPKECFFIKVVGKQAVQCAQQSMLLWKGLELIGCLQAPRRGIKNGMIYTIEEIDDERV